MEEILTPTNVADLLKIHVQTVYRLAAEGKIPGNRIGRSWRFSRADILGLISNHDMKSQKRAKTGGRKPDKKTSPNQNDEL